MKRSSAVSTRRALWLPFAANGAGVADTAYDFYEWLRIWGMLLGTFSKDLIPALNSVLHYRWMMSYLCCVGFMDKNTMGQHGAALKMSHLMIYDIFRYVAENLVLQAKGDAKNGNSAELNKKGRSLRRDDDGPDHGGFPDLIGIPYQLFAVFLVSEIDQLTCTVHRRRRVLRSPGRYLPGSDVRVRRARHRRPAASGQLLHLQLHAV